MIKAVINNVPAGSALGYTLQEQYLALGPRSTDGIFLGDGVTAGDGGLAGGSYCTFVDESLGATSIVWDTGGIEPKTQKIPLNIGDLHTAVTSPAGTGSYNTDSSPGFYCSQEDVFQVGLGLPWSKIDAQFEQVKSFFPDCTDVPSLVRNRLIPSAESEVDVFLKQTHKPTQVTHFLDGTGTDELWLPYAPILSVDKCAIYSIPSVLFLELTRPQLTKSLGAVDAAQFYGDADLLFDPETGQLKLPSRTLQGIAFTPFWNYSWLTGDKNIQVTWTYGFSDPANVPQSFRTGVASIVCIKLLEMLGLEYQGMASYKSGQTAKVVGRERNLPYADLIMRLDARVRHLLNDYKNMSG